MKPAPIVSARWIGVGSGAVAAAARERICAAAGRAIARHGRFLIVLAGGNTPREIYKALRGVAAQWPSWHVYLGDERCTPSDDPLRNSRMACEAWLDHVPIPRGQIHEIPAELGPVEGARAYCETLRDVGDFDLVVLGLGEDGHTASLFPGHDWGVTKGSPDALPVTGAPKPPPERVSLSANRLGRARKVLFLVEGESKRGAVAMWRAGADIPARAVRPPNGVDVLADAALLREP